MLSTVQSSRAAILSDEEQQSIQNLINSNFGKKELLEKIQNLLEENKYFVNDISMLKETNNENLTEVENLAKQVESLKRQLVQQEKTLTWVSTITSTAETIVPLATSAAFFYFGGSKVLAVALGTLNLPLRKINNLISDRLEIKSLDKVEDLSEDQTQVEIKPTISEQNILALTADLDKIPESKISRILSLFLQTVTLTEKEIAALKHLIDNFKYNFNVLNQLFNEQYKLLERKRQLLARREVLQEKIDFISLTSIVYDLRESANSLKECRFWGLIK